MNKELKNKWISALRSGVYEQVTGCLRTPAGSPYGRTPHAAHCCLDVLLCVSGERRGPQMACEQGGEADYQLVEKLVGGQRIRLKLQDMNDLDERTFRQIADYIEKHL
jgi:hypothetical protein